MVHQKMMAMIILGLEVQMEVIVVERQVHQEHEELHNKK